MRSINLNLSRTLNALQSLSFSLILSQTLQLSAIDDCNHQQDHNISIHTCLCECMHLNKVSIISLISMMMLMMLMKSMFQSYYLMLISIEIKCGEAVRQPRTNKDSSANDRGAAHAHAYDRHAIVTTIELQYTRALVHLRPPVLHFLSHCLSLTSLLSHIQRMPVG